VTGKSIRAGQIPSHGNSIRDSELGRACATGEEHYCTQNDADGRHSTLLTVVMGGFASFLSVQPKLMFMETRTEA
jgi:hypothetical protein